MWFIKWRVGYLNSMGYHTHWSFPLQHWEGGWPCLTDRFVTQKIGKIATLSPKFHPNFIHNIYLQKQDLIQVQKMFRKSSSWENNHTFYHKKPITFEETMIFWLPLWDMWLWVRVHKMSHSSQLHRAISRAMFSIILISLTAASAFFETCKTRRWNL